MLWVVLALTAAAVASGQSAQVQLGIIDNKQAQYIATVPSNPAVELSAEGAACIEASLLGLPCTSSGASAQAGVSQEHQVLTGQGLSISQEMDGFAFLQAEHVLKTDIFTRPEAILSLQVAGQTFGRSLL